MMDGNMTVDLDKLPIKRLEAIDEAGVEQFPPEVVPDEKRLDQIRRIDFSSVVEKDSKKAKTSKEAAAPAAPPLPWKSMVENLHLAHQELSVIIDLINTVEANDAVTVAGMTRPKQLPNELLADLAVSAATKLQHFRHLGRYFKQSSKALEQQVAREARFYGSLIRLQQNWKVKRQRPLVPGNEGFTIDLLDNSLSNPTLFSRPSSISTVRVDKDSGGLLTLQLPPKSCRSIHFGFLGGHPSRKPRKFSGRKVCSSSEHPSQEARKEPFNKEDVNECVKETHSTLRTIHQSIFQEQVFDLVNRETFYSSPGVYVTGMCEDYLQLGIGQETSVYLRLESSAEEDANQTIDSNQTQSGGGGVSHSDSLELMIVEEKWDAVKRTSLGLPDPSCFEIYLQYILHENVFLRAKERQASSVKPQVSSQSVGDGLGLLGHFCMTIAHRTFSNKVLSELENLVSRVPYLHLLSHPTWHSRTSSWSLTMKVPQSVLHAGQRAKLSDIHETRSGVRLQFHTKVVVNDELISVSGEGTPTIIGSFDGSTADTCLLNSYGCDLAGLPVIILQQVASQVIRWLHEEALVVGMKASMEFLCLYFELEQGEKLGLAAHVDPEDDHGCISWWLVMDDGSTEEGKLHRDPSHRESENRRFLGYLSLEALYSTLMDLVSLCSTGGS